MASGALVEHQYDVDGNRVQTRVTPPPSGSPVACAGNSAVYQRQDISSQGSWIGAYGADGQYISGEPAAFPSYGSVTLSNANQFTTSDGTNDIRALQQPPPQTSRILSSWSSSSETFHVATTDGNAHTVSFYMLDVYGDRITQTVTAQTTVGGTLDAARPFAGLQPGTWVTYTICGDVDFVFTGTNGTLAHVSGVFFGPPPGIATTTNMLVDAAGGLSQVVAETDGSGKLTAYYVRASDELLEVMRPGTTPGTWSTRYVQHDGIGSVRTLTDESGTTTDTRGYEAFGTKNASAGSDPLAYGYAGEPLEGASQLAYHRARWMDSRVGRFTGMDAILAQPAEQPVPGDDDLVAPYWSIHHAYNYASNDPVSRFDPSGMIDLEDLGGAAIGQQELNNVARVSFQGVARGIVQQVYGLQLRLAVRIGIGNSSRGLLHVLLRHSFATITAKAASKFLQGDGFIEITELIEEAVTLGASRFAPDRSYYVMTQYMPNPVGTDLTGQLTNYITVVVNAAGELITAYPGFPK